MDQRCGSGVQGSVRSPSFSFEPLEFLAGVFQLPGIIKQPAILSRGRMRHGQGVAPDLFGPLSQVLGGVTCFRNIDHLHPLTGVTPRPDFGEQLSR